MFEKILKLLSLSPPATAPPDADVALRAAIERDHAHWRWLVTAWIYGIAITTAWGFGWTPLPYSPLGNVEKQVGELKSALVCSNLKTDLERTRSELYAVQREIEMTPPDELTETVRRRHAELQAAMRDNETRYEKHGCYTVIG